MEGKIDMVCIVDDDDIYRLVASIEIKKTEMVNNIIVFPDGQKAISYFIVQKENLEKLPDIIFLDINMPVMDGWQFLEEYMLIKSVLPKSIVIYMVSSSVDYRDITRAKNISEVSGYLVKPIGKQRLLEVFKELIK